MICTTIGVYIIGIILAIALTSVAWYRIGYRQARTDVKQGISRDWLK